VFSWLFSKDEDDCQAESEPGVTARFRANPGQIPATGPPGYLRGLRTKTIFCVRRQVLSNLAILQKIAASAVERSRAVDRGERPHACLIARETPDD
jgi:hypothetical protein